jgi:hypothetical protein
LCFLRFSEAFSSSHANVTGRVYVDASHKAAGPRRIEADLSMVGIEVRDSAA